MRIALSRKFRIVVSRGDALGDLVLTLPLLGVLKERFGAQAEIYVLCQGAFAPLIRACIHAHDLVPWTPEVSALTEKLRGFDLLLHVFPHPRIALAGWRARIPARVGTLYRWYHLFTCNHLVALRRKGVREHETFLNLKLLAPLGIEAPPQERIHAYYGLIRIPELPERFVSQLDPGRFQLVLHPFSRGHGREWPLRHYLRLITLLPPERVQVILTGTKEERARMEPHGRWLPSSVVNLMGETTLEELMALLARVGGVVASGTGPLHLAAALGTRTLGLFPPLPGIGPERWAPLGARAEYLVAPRRCTGCPNPSHCACMESILPELVGERILRWVEEEKGK